MILNTSISSLIISTHVYYNLEIRKSLYRFPLSRARLTHQNPTSGRGEYSFTIVVIYIIPILQPEARPSLVDQEISWSQNYTIE